MLKKYEILEHKADLKIRVFGKNKKEVFNNALLGMFASAKYEGQGREVKKEIRISSLDLSSLLVDFLSEVLYFCETHKEIYEKIQFKKFTDQILEGILIGKKLKRIGVQIKGVTYHDLDIHQKKDKTWETTILFDI